MAKKHNNKTKNVIGAFLGTIVEYYDYSLYGFSAKILSNKFFPNQDLQTSLIYVFGIYAIAYLSKPIGAIFFSKMGDLYGRKTSLKITMIGIAVPTMVIGLLPEYRYLGCITIYILLLCRFLQGFFVAGEYDGAVIYVIEHLGDKHQHTASSITRATGVLGLILGIVSTNFFNSSIFPEWAWRIPFLLSAPFALITLYVRKSLNETPEFLNSGDIDTKLEIKTTSQFILTYWKSLLMVILLAGGFGVTYQVSIIFMKQYLPLVFSDISTVISSFSVIMVICFGITMPLAGMIADRIGLRIITLASLVSTLVSIMVLYCAIQYQLMNLVLGGGILLAISIAPPNALAHSIFIRLFHVKERYRGICIGHTTGSILMSGTANYMCITCMTIFDFKMFPLIYIGVFAILSFIMMHNFSKKIG